MRFLIPLLVAAAGFAADLNELARNPDALRAAVKADDLKKGTAWLGDHETVLFAIETEQPPTLVIDDGARTPMTRAAANLWTQVARLTSGRSHAFHYVVNGADFGGNLNVPVFLPDSYEQPGVPQGKPLRGRPGPIPSRQGDGALRRPCPASASRSPDCMRAR